MNESTEIIRSDPFEIKDADSLAEASATPGNANAREPETGAHELRHADAHKTRHVDAREPETGAHELRQPNAHKTRHADAREPETGAHELRHADNLNPGTKLAEALRHSARHYNLRKRT